MILLSVAEKDRDQASDVLEKLPTPLTRESALGQRVTVEGRGWVGIRVARGVGTGLVSIPVLPQIQNPTQCLES